jgi:hypothetical protein
MDVVIQGGMWSQTLDTARYYTELDYIDKVVVSTWEDENVSESDLNNEDVILVKSKKPEPELRSQNVNLHMISSLNGVKACPNDLIMKIRSDQRILHHSFDRLRDFYEEHKNEPTTKYLDGSEQKTKIFVIGNNSVYPFHPQDHLFWGYKEDLVKLFSPPLFKESIVHAPIDFNKHLRAPIFVGANYYALFYEDAARMAEDPETYLMDSAPKRDEAMESYTPIRDSIFRVFPRIDLDWYKYNSKYWYSYEHGGEYYAD